MQLAWGNTLFPVNGADVTTRLTAAQRTDWGLPLTYSGEFNVTAWIEGDGQADLSAKELAFRASLLVPNKDLILYTDDGRVSSAAILTARTTSGTRVTSISTPTAREGEFVTKRTISFTVEAEFAVVDAANAVVTWQETLTIIGNGGPRRVWRFPINGPAIRQTVSPFSLVRAVQSGQGVGFKGRPRLPPPLFPAYLVNDAMAVTAVSPRRAGAGFEGFGVQWQYAFERGDGPLVGFPGLPPGVI